MKPEISIVVPLRNESPNLRPLVDEVLQAFQAQPRPFELLLVDDGSDDDTWARIQELSRSEPRIRGLRHFRNAGQSAALWSGFKASLGEIIATIDGDLQNSPADLVPLLQKLEHADMVCGARVKRQDTWVRRVSSTIARSARRLVLGAGFRDTGCNLRVFKRSIVDRLPPFNGLHRFMPILAKGAGAIVLEVPVSHHPRVAGVSKYGIGNRLFRGIYDLFMVRWFLKRQFPAVGTELFPPKK